MSAYAELHALSNFTFLRGASHPEELVETAAELGYEALALTDECTVSGIVRAHIAAKEAGIEVLADWNSEWTKAAGLNFSAPPVGFIDRCRIFYTCRSCMELL